MRLLLAFLLFSIAAPLSVAQSSSIPSPKTNPQNAFSEDDANRVLHELKAALESHSQRRFLVCFDPDSMNGYLDFQAQLQNFFNRYNSIVVYYRIVQITAAKSLNTAQVELQMEASANEGSDTPTRRDQQLRIAFAPTKKGWKISDLQPRTIFAP